ncbi:MAG: hypothetical protein HW380_3232 [Magnetococcales bacterium]|nr:hypothetical protein [Magnetococcales bacterium]
MFSKEGDGTEWLPFYMICNSRYSYGEVVLDLSCKKVVCAIKPTPSAS